MKQVLRFLGCVGLTMGTGALSGFLTRKEIGGWYATLRKPSFNPPNWVFGPVWSSLYFLMGVSLFLVIHASGDKRAALGWFFAQLALNFTWSLVFFNGHRIGWALADILLLLAGIVAMIIQFYKLRKSAGLLQLPYLAWVSFATALNAAIYRLN